MRLSRPPRRGLSLLLTTLLLGVSAVAVAQTEPYSGGTVPSSEGVPVEVTPLESGLTVTVTAAGVTGPCTWDFGDGTTGTGNPATHTYAEAGTYTVSGTCSTTFTIPVTVGSAAALPGGPVVAAATPAFASFILAQTATVPSVSYTTSGLSATFTATGVEPECEWNFGDGETGSGNPVTHTYAAAGSYTATGTCPVVLSLQVTPAEEAATLASTGFELMPWVLGAVVLLGAGGGLVFAGRRRVRSN